MGSRFETLRLKLAGLLTSTPEKRDLSFSSPHMKEIEAPMLKALKGLWPHIQAAEYSIIISDDISGRIPTMVWQTLIDRVYMQRGIEPIAVASIKMKLNDSYALRLITELQRMATEMVARRPGTRALISTEHMGQGRHVKDIARFLNAVNVPFDVVSISTEKDPHTYDSLLNIDSRLFSGCIDVGSPIANLRPWDFARARKDVPVMAALLLSHAQLFLPQVELNR